jgi:UDP-galactopyranose mutase
MFDAVIIGAGFAGAVLAERLATQQNKKVLLVEKRQHIGGNCYDYRDENGIIVHKYGPHLFHSNSRQVWDYLSKFTEWDIYQHHVLACIDGKPVPIPFNLNTLYEVFPASMASRLENKLLENYEYNSKVPILQLKQSEDKDLQFLADFVYEKIFVHYTMKQWDMKPEDIDGAVTARVPVFIGRDNRYFNDEYQGVPKNGYTEIFNNMLNHPNIKLMLNTSAKEIMEFSDGKIKLMGMPFEGKVIYTGLLDDLFDYKFGELPYRSVDMRFETISKRDYQEAATVNYPNNYEFTRITEFKKIHYADTSNTTILKEFPQRYVRGENTPYYPIFTEENQAMYGRYAEEAKKYSQLLLVGRLAEYRYYDMDDIVERALSVYDDLVK